MTDSTTSPGDPPEDPVFEDDDDVGEDGLDGADGLLDPEGAAARARLPDRAALLEFIRAQEGRVGKREIAKAFNIKGVDRVALKRLLREMAADGDIEMKNRRTREAPPPGGLPPVTLLEVVEVDGDGDLRARPARWEGDGAPPPITLAPFRPGGPALGPGDRFLGRLVPLGEGAGAGFQAKIIKKLGREARRAIGLFEASRGGGRIQSVDKRGGDELFVEADGLNGARTGELVEVEILPGRRHGLKKARVLERLGDQSEPRAISRIAILEQGVPIEFPEEAEAEAETAVAITGLEGRLDLRDTPLITIDPEDARDHDDAVHAEPDPDPANPGGHALWVAIADVAAYVTPGSALDRAARLRGNSAYFPDRVVPMLPERLSADLCSLREGVDRPCLAVRMTISAEGALKSARFHRAMMRSAARLTYEEAQAAREGAPSARTEPLMATVIAPLFAAYDALMIARERRAPLDLDLPERRVTLDAAGRVASVAFRDRFDAHKLIEECMILANVAAAEALEARRTPALRRVHEEPNPEKIETLREILGAIGIPLAKGQVMTPRLLNRALEAGKGGEHAELVNISVLRAQTQAYYSADPLGHFGLALRAYAHFTSPIRRYADLVVHRALIRALSLGPDPARDGLSALEQEGLAATAEHISMTERRAMTAERDTTDRYLAAYLADRRGAEFEARISGVQRFGLFLKLEETGADGFVPMSLLPGDRYRLDETGSQLIGARGGATLSLGQPVRARLVEATPVSGGMVFELVELPVGGRGGRRRGGRAKVDATQKARRVSRAKIAKAKLAGRRKKR